jgi:hypothetical protein
VTRDDAARFVSDVGSKRRLARPRATTRPGIGTPAATRTASMSDALAGRRASAPARRRAGPNRIGFVRTATIRSRAWDVALDAGEDQGGRASRAQSANSRGRRPRRSGLEQARVELRRASSGGEDAVAPSRSAARRRPTAGDRRARECSLCHYRRKNRGVLKEFRDGSPVSLLKNTQGIGVHAEPNNSR